MNLVEFGGKSLLRRCSLDRDRMQMTRFLFYDHDATQSECAHRLAGICTFRINESLLRVRALKVVA